MLRTEGLGRWWPLLLIGVGVVKVRQPREDGQRAAGVALLLLGGLFQLTSVLAFSSSWPLLMVAFGAFLLWQGVEGPRRAGGGRLGLALPVGHGARRLPQAQPPFRRFPRRLVTAVMGGVELDLRKAVLTRRRPTSTSSPSGEGSRSRSRPGGRSTRASSPSWAPSRTRWTPPPRPAGPRLVLRGHAIMGAVVIGS